MDGTSPLNANGIPFVLERYTSEGVLGEDQIDPMFDGKPVTLNTQRAGARANQLPLNNEVIDFGN